MHFRLFYPEFDALTVVGKDNASYWLMLLVRSDAIHNYKSAYFVAVAFEIFFLLAGFTLHIRGFTRFWRLRALHINFNLTVAGMYAVAIIGSIARLFTIPYELRLVTLAGLHESPMPFLAVLRQASYADIFLILWVVTIERTFATIYVADYEKKSRLHIPLFLNAAILVLSYCIGYAVVTNISMAHSPQRRLARLNDRLKRHPDVYSLSLRLQLKENIWSMRKIEFGVYLLTLGLAASVLLIFVPFLTLTAPGQFEALQWCTCLANLVYALSVFLTAPWLDVAIAIHTGNVPNFLRFIVGRKRMGKTTSRSESDDYFTQLESQWNYGLSIHKSRAS